MEHFGVSEIFGERKTLCIREGVSSFFIENILSHSTKKFRRGTLRCIRNFRRAKNFMHQRGGIKFLRWKHFVTQYQKISPENTSVYQKFSESEKLYASERGVSHFFVENILSHSTKKFRRGALRCIRNFRRAKNFMHQRGGYHISSLKTFCHTVPKNFVGEHFGVSEIFGERKTLCIREGVTSFFIENILSHSTKKFHRGTLRCIRNFRRAKNFMHQRGGIKFLHWKHFVIQHQKISPGNTSVYQKFSESEKLYASERGYQVSSLKSFCHTVPKTFVREHFGVSENFVQR